MQKTGLFFGSFNPIHIGHLALANYMAEFTDLDEVWFVVSPHNPLKEKKSLLADNHRFYMTNLAVEDDPRFYVSNIEFSLPKPSYTTDTMARLTERYPHKKFALIMGSDGLTTFHKWKNSEFLIANYERYVYPRPGVQQIDLSEHENIRLVEAPQMDISSSFIRKAVKDRKDIPYFMPSKAYDFMMEMGFYR